MLGYLPGEWGRDGVTINFFMQGVPLPGGGLEIYLAVDVDGELRLRMTSIEQLGGPPRRELMDETNRDWPTLRPFARLFAPGDALQLEHTLRVQDASGPWVGGPPVRDGEPPSVTTRDNLGLRYVDYSV